ncbi:MAG: cysteine hydrolase family protein [Methylocystaceae bacterium]
MGRHCITVIDMLNDFIGEKAPLRCPDGEKIVPALQKLVEFAHQDTDKFAVAFIQEAHRDKDADFRVRPRHAIKGSWGSDFIPDLMPNFDKGDYVVQKRRHSAFAYTDFDLYCREEDVDTVVVTGVWTNVCVRSTASDALYHTYRVIAISDCCASATKEMHEAGLVDIGIFGRVMTLDEYMKEFGK